LRHQEETWREEEVKKQKQQQQNRNCNTSIAKNVFDSKCSELKPQPLIHSLINITVK
jgi:hypothetical protein